jgi:adrenodoxin-NADP+ reductase
LRLVLHSARPLTHTQNCTHKFDELARDPRFRYFGNVQFGASSARPIAHSVHLPLADLTRSYTHLVLASGCALPTPHAALTPSARVLPALDVVHWYTQHPSRPPAPPLDNAAHVTVVGQGNVALDVARMLLAPPEHLAHHDVPAPVLAALRASSVRHVSIVGRRGPLQAAFTAKEVRELLALDGVAMRPLDPAVLAPLANAKLSRQQARVLDLLKRGSTRCAPDTAHKTWSLDFFRAPAGVTPTPGSSAGALELTLAHTAIGADQRAFATGATSVLRTDLVVAALGQTLDPATPFYDAAARRVPVGAGGAVLHPSGRPLRNVFASGWAAMGARGVLATTMMDAYGVAEGLAARLLGADAEPADVVEGVMAAEVADDAPPALVGEALARGDVVTYKDWKTVDAEEVRRGAALGKERERMDWEDARTFLASSRA